MFSIGDKVCLKIDRTKIGAVIAITPVGDKTYQYQVFHNGDEIEFYYEEQLSLIVETPLIETPFYDFLGLYSSFRMQLDTTSTFFTLNSGKIKFIPFQFRPLARILNAERPRLLIADEVGVGKTIEAGLILKEFEKRDAVQSAIIICPKELTSKWRNEMKIRFDESFEVLTSDRLQYCIRELELEGMWPVECSKCIVGLELFRRKEIIDRLESVEDPARFDMLIVDEAHHVINPTGNSHKIVEYFCECCNVAVFLSATPLQLGSSDLFSLLNLLLPEEFINKATFDTVAEPNKFINTAISHIRNNHSGWQREVIAELNRINVNSWANIVFSNNGILKYWLKRLSESEPITCEERIECLKALESLHTFSHIINRTKRKDIGEFTIREPITVEIIYSPEEQAFYHAVRKFKTTILNTRYDMRTTALIMSTIERQITSCLPAFVTLLDSFIERGLHCLTELSDDVDDENYSEADDTAFCEYAMQLKRLSTSLPPHDGKTERLLEIIHQITSSTGSGKLLVFSFFKHTLHYLSEILSNNGIRVAVITGDTAYEDREDYRRRFRQDRSIVDSIDVLLSSEVGCEGLDYEFCSSMVNYDIPWNPMKIEQRIGRIDRFGQKSPKVRIYNFITNGTVEEKIFYRCFMRLGIFESTIGDLEGILGNISTELTQTAFSMDLSEEQQEIRAQQLADNAIRLVQEQRRFETDSQNLFLMDITAEDQKMTEERALQIQWQKTLIFSYVKHMFGTEACKDIGIDQLKLRLYKEDKQKLLDELTSMKRKRTVDRNSTEAKKLENYLKSDQQVIVVTFSSDSSTIADTKLVVSAVHPLLKMALKTMSLPDNTMYTSFKIPVNLASVPRGCYLFACYRWKECGYKQNQKIQAVLLKEDTKQVLELETPEFEKMLLSGSPCALGQIPNLSVLDTSIYRKQQLAKNRLLEINQDVIQRKLSTLDRFYSGQISKNEHLLNQSDNEKMRKMYHSVVEKLKNSWNVKRKEITDKAEADVIVALVAGGRLVVE